jgi:anti-anti-sigma factor
VNPACIVTVVEAPLEVRTERRDDRLLIALAGELDLVNAPRWEEQLGELEADSPGTLILDLRGITFIDSTGLRAVISADQRARSAGRRLVVVGGAEAVDRLFAVTQLDQRLEIVDDPDAVGGRGATGD